MGNYKIAVEYSICGTVNVEASSFEEALIKAEECATIEMQNKSYIDGSWIVNEEMSKEFNKGVISE